MLSKLIINAYKIIIEVALWATLFIAIIAGWPFPTSPVRCSVRWFGCSGRPSFSARSCCRTFVAA